MKRACEATVERTVVAAGPAAPWVQGDAGRQVASRLRGAAAAAAESTPGSQGELCQNDQKTEAGTAPSDAERQRYDNVHYDQAGTAQCSVFRQLVFCDHLLRSTVVITLRSKKTSQFYVTAVSTKVNLFIFAYGTLS